MHKSIQLIIKKDIREVFTNKVVCYTMIGVPLGLSLLIPVMMLIAAQKEYTGLATLEMLLKLVPDTMDFSSTGEKLYYIGLNKIIPLIFLTIPIFMTVNMGAISFVGEREKRTLETLFYSPVSQRGVFIAKVLGTFLMAYAITLSCFLVVLTVSSIGSTRVFGQVFMEFDKWLTIVLWFSPLLSIFALNMIVFISAKSSNTQAAIQSSLFLVLPVLGMIISQMTGYLEFNVQKLFMYGAVILVLDIVLMVRVPKILNSESLI